MQKPQWTERVFFVQKLSTHTTRLLTIFTHTIRFGFLAHAPVNLGESTEKSQKPTTRISTYDFAVHARNRQTDTYQ